MPISILNKLSVPEGCEFSSLERRSGVLYKESRAPTNWPHPILPILDTLYQKHQITCRSLEVMPISILNKLSVPEGCEFSSLERRSGVLYKESRAPTNWPQPILPILDTLYQKHQII